MCADLVMLTAMGPSAAEHMVGGAPSVQSEAFSSCRGVGVGVGVGTHTNQT